jgi:hypothetical protein
MSRFWSKQRFVALSALMVCVASVANAAAPAMVLNEWNCVKEDEEMSGSDSVFGTVEGNGGNWVELYVVQNNLTIKNWLLEWQNADAPEQNNHGFVEFTTSGAWENLAAGTIITILEVDENLEQGAYTTTNLSAGTNWKHVTVDNDTYVEHFPAGFKVDNDDWEMRILRPRVGSEAPYVTVNGGQYVVVQSWVGESASGYGGSGINSEEIGKLEACPSTLSSSTDLTGYDDGDNSTFGHRNTWTGGSQASCSP